MKITIETPRPGEEEEVIIRCAHMDERMMHFIQELNAERDVLMGYQEDKIIRLSVKDIYYFESVDNKVFAYTGNGVYEVRRKLYELAEKYGRMDFLRISKSTIVNISKIAYLRPIFNGRFEAKLKNEEKIIISRQYVVELKKKLGI